jgi:alpha-tubulin suppressor-like RCC1 family protein
VTCWGAEDAGPFDFGQVSTVPNTRENQAITGGSYQGCAITRTQDIDCWGSFLFGASSPPGEEAVHIDLNEYHGCIVTTEGSVRCWAADGSKDRDHLLAEPSGDDFTEVAAGLDHSCARRTDGTVECWGSDSQDQLDVPDIE